MKQIIILTSFIVLLSCTAANAQHRRGHDRQFDFELRGGPNFCQIDGDGSGNYSKIGFHGAVNTSFPLSDGSDWRLVVELGVSQKGSHIVNSTMDRTISLLYVELPIMLTYNLLEDRLRIGAGFAPAILAKAKVTTNGAYDQLQSDNYKTLDALPLCLSVRYRFTDHIGADIRLYNSMLNTAIENHSGTYRIFRSNKGQFNHILQAGITLNF